MMRTCLKKPRYVYAPLACVREDFPRKNCCVGHSRMFDHKWQLLINWHVVILSTVEIDIKEDVAFRQRRKTANKPNAVQAHKHTMGEERKPTCTHGGGGAFTKTDTDTYGTDDSRKPYCFVKTRLACCMPTQAQVNRTARHTSSECI